MQFSANFAQSRMLGVENKIILFHKYMKTDCVDTDLVQLLGCEKGKRYFLLAPFCNWYQKKNSLFDVEIEPIEKLRRHFWDLRDFVAREILRRTCADVFGGATPKMLKDLCRKAVCDLSKSDMLFMTIVVFQNCPREMITPEHIRYRAGLDVFDPRYASRDMSDLKQRLKFDKDAIGDESDGESVTEEQYFETVRNGFNLSPRESSNRIVAQPLRFLTQRHSVDDISGKKFSKLQPDVQFKILCDLIMNEIGRLLVHHKELVNKWLQLKNEIGLR